MEYRRNDRLVMQAVRSRLVVRALDECAHQLAPQIAAGTKRLTGETALSTHVETGHRSADGSRPAVRIVQRNVSVPLNFRLDRDYIVRSVGGA